MPHNRSVYFESIGFLLATLLYKWEYELIAFTLRLANSMVVAACSNDKTSIREVLPLLFASFQI